MLYKKGDRVVLRTDLEEGESAGSLDWLDNFNQWGESGVVIGYVDSNDKTYQVVEPSYWIAEEMIDHDATAKLEFGNVWDDLVREILGEPYIAPDPDSLSITIKIHGAKEYRDKLEELHRHIETVERTIEQLNEMDMTIEIDD